MTRESFRNQRKVCTDVGIRRGEVVNGEEEDEDIVDEEGFEMKREENGAAVIDSLFAFGEQVITPKDEARRDLERVRKAPSRRQTAAVGEQEAIDRAESPERGDLGENSLKLGRLLLQTETFEPVSHTTRHPGFGAGVGWGKVFELAQVCHQFAPVGHVDGFHVFVGDDHVDGIRLLWDSCIQVVRRQVFPHWR